MKQKWSPQPTAIPTKNRFEALQAQDPSSSQLQETIIENIKKKKKWYTKEKSKQTAYAPGHVTSNQEQKQWRSDKHLPRRSDEKSNTTKPKGPSLPTTPLKGQTHKGLPFSPPAEDHTDAPALAKGASPPPINITLQDPRDTIALILSKSGISTLKESIQVSTFYTFKDETITPKQKIYWPQPTRHITHTHLNLRNPTPTY